MKVVSSGAQDVAARSHSMVLKQDGSVWATGKNDFGQLGDGSTTGSTRFVQVVASRAKAVAASIRFSMVLKQDGKVLATGENNYGQLGDGSTADRTRFFSIGT